MSKYIKVSQLKEEDMQIGNGNLEKMKESLEAKQDALDEQAEKIDDMEDITLSNTEDLMLKISKEILKKTASNKLSFNQGTIKIAEHFPKPETRRTKYSGVAEDYAGGLGYLYNDNATECEACGEMTNEDGLCENPHCENFNIKEQKDGYILDKRNKYPEEEFDIDALDSSK